MTGRFSSGFSCGAEGMPVLSFDNAPRPAITEGGASVESIFKIIATAAVQTAMRIPTTTIDFFMTLSRAERFAVALCQTPCFNFSIGPHGTNYGPAIRR